MATETFLKWYPYTLTSYRLDAPDVAFHPGLALVVLTVEPLLASPCAVWNEITSSSPNSSSPTMVNVVAALAVKVLLTVTERGPPPGILE